MPFYQYRLIGTCQIREPGNIPMSLKNTIPVPLPHGFHPLVAFIKTDVHIYVNRSYPSRLYEVP
jgi:hypothetical protein